MAIDIYEYRPFTCNLNMIFRIQLVYLYKMNKMRLASRKCNVFLSLSIVLRLLPIAACAACRIARLVAAGIAHSSSNYSDTSTARCSTWTNWRAVCAGACVTASAAKGS